MFVWRIYDNSNGEYVSVGNGRSRPRSHWISRGSVGYAFKRLPTEQRASCVIKKFRLVEAE